MIHSWTVYKKERCGLCEVCVYVNGGYVREAT